MGKIAENDHVGWLKKAGAAARQAAEKAEDEKQRTSLEERARRLFRVADAMEMLERGTDPGAMGGHMGLLKRLGRGARVVVRLLDGGELVGLISAMGRYDFALLEDDGRELVVPKHAVLCWTICSPAKGEEGGGE